MSNDNNTNELYQTDLKLKAHRGFFVKTAQIFGTSAKYNLRIKIPLFRRFKIPNVFPTGPGKFSSTGGRRRMIRNMVDKGLNVSETARNQGINRKTLRVYANSDEVPISN